MMNASTPPSNDIAIEGSNGYYEVRVRGHLIGNVHRVTMRMVGYPTVEGWVAVDEFGDGNDDRWFLTRAEALVVLGAAASLNALARGGVEMSAP